jgi:hypothetical protein
MAQSAPKVCAARVWCQGFVSSNSVTLSQPWHVKCISESRSSTYLQGVWPRSVFFPSLSEAVIFCNVLTAALPSAGCQKRPSPCRMFESRR